MTLAQIAMELDLHPVSYEEALGPVAATIIKRMRKGGYEKLEVDLLPGVPEVALIFIHGTIQGEVVSVKARTVNEAFEAAIRQALAHHRSRSGGASVQSRSGEVQIPRIECSGDGGDHILPGVQDTEQQDGQTNAGPVDTRFV